MTSTTLGGGGVNQILTFADRGEGGAQNGKKNADVINERPLMSLPVDRLNGDKLERRPLMPKSTKALRK